MLTSFDLLETLDNHTDMIVETLQDDEKRQFIGLLSEIVQVKNERSREDAVDALCQFCWNFPAIDELLKKVDDSSSSVMKGRPIFSPSEKEQQTRLFVNRLIKATKKLLQQAPNPKEKKSDEHD